MKILLYRSEKVPSGEAAVIKQETPGQSKCDPWLMPNLGRIAVCSTTK